MRLRSVLPHPSNPHLSPSLPLSVSRQLAERHRSLSLLRRCTLAWQRAVRDSLSQKRAAAERLRRESLLRRGFGGWKRVCTHSDTTTHLELKSRCQTCKLTFNPPN